VETVTVPPLRMRRELRGQRKRTRRVQALRTEPHLARLAPQRSPGECNENLVVVFAIAFEQHSFLVPHRRCLSKCISAVNLCVQLFAGRNCVGIV
jgi:hypothetical protein